jgi:hypothetical protein
VLAFGFELLGVALDRRLLLRELVSLGAQVCDDCGRLVVRFRPLLVDGDLVEVLLDRLRLEEAPF